MNSCTGAIGAAARHAESAKPKRKPPRSWSATPSGSKPVRRHVDSNPALGVCLPQKHSVLPKITFEPSQVMKILERLEEPHRTVVSVAAVTGLRASELFGLKWSDVDFERQLLFIRRTFYRGEFGLPKTKSSERVVPFSSGLATALERHKKSQQPFPHEPSLPERSWETL